MTTEAEFLEKLSLFVNDKEIFIAVDFMVKHLSEELSVNGIRMALSFLREDGGRLKVLERVLTVGQKNSLSLDSIESILSVFETHEAREQARLKFCLSSENQ